jgi:hypothetical protein
MVPEPGERVFALADAWIEAWIGRDRSTLEELLHPDFVHSGASFAGRPLHRAEWLDFAINACRLTGYSFGQPVFRMVLPLGTPGVGAFTAMWDMQAEMRGENISGRFWTTDTWREGGRHGWQVMHRSTAPLDSLAATSRAYAAGA